jgi:hypothetical protein
MKEPDFFFGFEGFGSSLHRKLRMGTGMRCQKTGGGGGGRPRPRSSRAATWADRKASEVTTYFNSLNELLYKEGFDKEILFLEF